MREVSGCDFCGGTPSGTFDVLPREYDPEGKGKRMVLCDHCRDALASILDPLLDAKAEDVEPRVDPESIGTSDGTTGTEPTNATEPSADASEPRQPANAEGGDDEADPDNADSSDRPRMAKTAEGTSSRVPRGYRKTIRFLQNRETPIERDAAVAMVSDAYEFDPDAVEAAIDHAVKHGRLKQLQDEIDVA